MTKATAIDRRQWSRQEIAEKLENLTRTPVSAACKSITIALGSSNGSGH